MLGVGHSVQSSGCRVRVKNKVYRVMSVGVVCRLLGVGCEAWDAGCRVWGIGCREQGVGVGCRV